MTELRLVRMASAVRRGVVARPRLRSLMWYGGLVVLAVGLVLALERVWAAVAPALLAGAVLMWLAGAWVLPWSRDGYLRRLMRLWNAWATHAQWAYSQFSQGQAKFGDRLAALAPPPELSLDHERLVSLVAEADRLRSDSAIPFAERVRQVMPTQPPPVRSRTRLSVVPSPAPADATPTPSTGCSRSAAERMPRRPLGQSARVSCRYAGR